MGTEIVTAFDDWEFDLLLKLGFENCVFEDGGLVTVSEENNLVIDHCNMVVDFVAREGCSFVAFILVIEELLNLIEGSIMVIVSVKASVDLVVEGTMVDV